MVQKVCGKDRSSSFIFLPKPRLLCVLSLKSHHSLPVCQIQKPQSSWIDTFQHPSISKLLSHSGNSIPFPPYHCHSLRRRLIFRLQNSRQLCWIAEWFKMMGFWVRILPLITWMAVDKLLNLRDSISSFIYVFIYSKNIECIPIR